MPTTRPIDTVEDRIRAAYDMVADDCARLLPDASFEDVLDVSMIDAFTDAVRGALTDPAAVTNLAPGGARVLDVGCGTGRMTAHLAARGLPVDGLDPSPGMVRAARAAHPDLTFGIGSLTSLPAADGDVAGLLAWYSIIHTSPAGLVAVAAEARRVLTPGGFALFGFHAGTGPRAVRHAYGHDIELTVHRHDPDAVQAVLTAAGLEGRARLVRAARESERDDQAMLLVRRVS